MKKKVGFIAIAIVLTIVMMFSVTACSNFTSVPAQIDVLTELVTGNTDIGVLDSVLAQYYVSQDSSYSGKLQLVDGITLATEQYGIGFRKGSAIADKVNSELVNLYNNGKITEIAQKYGLADEIVAPTYTSQWDSITDKSDWEYVVARGKIVIGYTIFAPIAYPDVSNTLVGFDIELAKEVCLNLGLEASFEEIVWETKEVELNSKTIDCIWNGMTITDERKSSMEMSVPYMNNRQVAVIRVADKDLYTTEESLVKGKLAAEAGSAGEEVIKELIKKYK